MSSLPELTPERAAELRAAIDRYPTNANWLAKKLPRYHDQKFGFAVYRIVYGNDAEWSEFMRRLTGYAEFQFSLDRHGDLMKNNFTWDIMEDRSQLEGASKVAVQQ